MNIRLPIWTALAAVLMLVPAGGPAVAADDVPLMTIEELETALDGGDVLVLDARSGRDWSASEFKIRRALRTAPRDYAEWSKTLPRDKRLVLYCA